MDTFGAKNILDKVAIVAIYYIY